MNPRILLVLASLALSVLLGTVLARRPADPTTTTRRPGGNGSPIRIGLSLDTLKEERWQRDRDRFTATAAQLGAEVLVQSANSDDTRQMQDVESLLTAGVDVLVIVPHDGKAMARAVTAARQQNVPVISYDRLITDSPVTLYVSFDNVKVGAEQARYLVSKLPAGKGKIVRLYGSPTDNNAKLFKQGQDQILQPLIDRGDIQVLHEDWVLDWKPENAKKIMNAALTAAGLDLHAVLASNDGTAGGALQALAENGLTGKGIIVTGQDADLAACERILRGTQTMTIYKPLSRIADAAATAAVLLAQRDIPMVNGTVHNGLRPIPSLLSDVIAVDRANLHSTVIADGFHPAASLPTP